MFSHPRIELMRMPKQLWIYLIPSGSKIDTMDHISADGLSSKIIGRELYGSVIKSELPKTNAAYANGTSVNISITFIKKNVSTFHFFKSTRMSERRNIVINDNHGILDIERNDHNIGVVITMEKGEQYIGSIYDCTDSDDLKIYFDLLADGKYELNLNRKTIKGLGFTITLADSTLPKIEIKLLAAQIMNQRLTSELTEAINEMKSRDAKIITNPFIFSHGWSNYGDGYTECSYYIKDGRVYLEGLVRGSDEKNDVIATLPFGFRPANRLIFAVNSGLNVHGTINIHPDGTINFIRSGVRSYNVSLSGISFLHA
jgi:hypothetical protein